MTAIPVVNPTLAGVAYTKTTGTVADTFAAQLGGVYLVNIECGATGNTVTFDDINSVAPQGAAAPAGWSDVAVVVAPNTNKTVKIAVNRFLNSGTGNVALTSATPATTTYSILGPL